MEYINISDKFKYILYSNIDDSIGLYSIYKKRENSYKEIVNDTLQKFNLKEEDTFSIHLDINEREKISYYIKESEYTLLTNILSYILDYITKISFFDNKNLDIKFNNIRVYLFKEPLFLQTYIECYNNYLLHNIWTIYKEDIPYKKFIYIVIRFTKCYLYNNIIAIIADNKYLLYQTRTLFIDKIYDIIDNTKDLSISHIVQEINFWYNFRPFILEYKK